MVLLGSVFFLVSTLIGTVGSIWLLVVAFRTNVVWGLACLFIPFAFFVFVAKYWSEAGKPFVIMVCSIPSQVLGIVLLIAGASAGGGVDLGLGGGVRNFNFQQGSQDLISQDQISENRDAQLAVAQSSRRVNSPSSAATPFVEQPRAATPSEPPDTVSQGDEFRPVSPLTPMPSLQFDPANVIPSSVMGWEVGSEFSDVAPAGGILIGLRIGEDVQGFGNVKNIRPIYQIGNRCVYGDAYGPDGGTKREVVARSGYAIGGLLLRTSAQVETIQAIFCKVKPDGSLDSKDQYLSEQIGQGTGRKRRIFSDGRPVVEVFGHASHQLFGVGLSVVQTATEPAPSGLTKSESANRQPVQPERVKPDEPTKPMTQPSVDSGTANAAQSQPATSEPIRTWKSALGSFSVDAKFKSLSGNIAVLEQKDGRTVRVEIDKLSLADQEYLKSRQPK